MKTQFKTINWKEVKELCDSKLFACIGTAYFQINNQGEFTISLDQTRIYKRRNSSYDLIAKAI